METIKPNSLSQNSPILWIGLFFVYAMLSGCFAEKTPEETTLAFWQALSEGNLEQAKSYALDDSQQLIKREDIDKNAEVSVGGSEIGKNEARVQTTIVKNKVRLSFSTILQHKEDVWKVDYLQTRTNISLAPIAGFIKDMTNVGEAVGKQLEQELPKIQGQLESLGKNLNKQLEAFGKALEKPNAPQQKPNSGDKPSI